MTRALDKTNRIFSRDDVVYDQKGREYQVTGIWWSKGVVVGYDFKTLPNGNVEFYRTQEEVLLSLKDGRLKTNGYICPEVFQSHE